jgi:Leucine-rich repeat (LRR) protein
LSGLPPSLTNLTIAGFDALTSIEPNSFQHLPDLEKLSLKKNSIEQIEPAAFNYLNKLTRLDLKQNRLTDFRFDELPANAEPCCLKVLDLSENRLSFLSKRFVNNLSTSLVSLDLIRNEIVNIESGAFEGLVNLRSLNLNGNLFKTFDLNNVINGGTVNLLLLDIRCGITDVKILYPDSSQQENKEVAYTEKKRTQRKSVLKFPIKNLRNRLTLYSFSRDSFHIKSINGELNFFTD